MNRQKGMRLYCGDGPNSYRVRIFTAEKGIEVPQVRIDFAKGEHRSAEFLKLNSLGQIPVLVLDDGTVITESVAICRYFETLHPSPALFGADAVSAGKVEMWNRRAEIRDLWHDRECRAAYGRALQGAAGPVSGIRRHPARGRPSQVGVA